MADQTTPSGPPSTFVVAKHEGLGVEAVVARGALDVLGNGDWQYVRDTDSPAVSGPLGADEPAADGGPFDPSAHTVPEVLAHLEQADETERQRVLAAETSGKGRTTILDGQES